MMEKLHWKFDLQNGLLVDECQSVQDTMRQKLNADTVQDPFQQLLIIHDVPYVHIL